MRFLFDSRGQHIANEVDGQLHAPTGENIGHFLQDYNIFIDMSGRYLGEVLCENRHLYNRSSSHLSSNFGAYGNYGNAGNYGSPGNDGSIGAIGGYDDIETPCSDSKTG